MANTYVTGDTHGNNDFGKLFYFNQQNKKLTKKDVIIIAGDCGFIWMQKDNDRDEIKLKFKLNNFKFSVFCILGNHENYDRIEKLPTKIKYGAKVYYEPLFPNIVYAIHGKIYKINGINIWTMNGAYSIDKFRRIPHLSWWKQEIPTQKQLDSGLKNYIKNQDKIDVIITHTCPYSIEPLDRSPFKMEQYGIDKTVEKYLDNIWLNLGGKEKQ